MGQSDQNCVVRGQFSVFKLLAELIDPKSGIRYGTEKQEKWPNIIKEYWGDVIWAKKNREQDLTSNPPLPKLKPFKIPCRVK